jgi:DNA repair exonuclease SbcCD ATPase subunit
MRLTLLSLLVLLVAAPAVSRAQSLGDVAKREEEKQEKKKKSGKPPAKVKVYTDEDLKKARESESGALTVLPENGNLESGAAASSSDDDEVVSGEGRPAGGRRRTEAYWRGRATRAREAVDEADGKVRDLEARIAALRNDMNPVNTQDPNRLQTRDRELQEATDGLDAARRAADAARKAQADLEEEARRAGALPGWVR